MELHEENTLRKPCRILGRAPFGDKTAVTNEWLDWSPIFVKTMNSLQNVANLVCGAAQCVKMSVSRFKLAVFLSFPFMAVYGRPLMQLDPGPVKSLFKKVAMTPSCERILERFESFSTDQGSPEPSHLVLAMLMEESLGSKCLNNLGMTIGTVAEGCMGEASATAAMTFLETTSGSPDVLAFCSAPRVGVTVQPIWCSQVQDRARNIARSRPLDTEVSSEHLLQAMVELDGPLKELLLKRGVSADAVMAELGLGTPEAETLEVDFELTVDEIPRDPAEVSPLSIDHAGQMAEDANRVLALIDANLNRAREGLRVLEDFSRFVQRDLRATTAIKQLRHDLVSAERLLRDECAAICHRDTVSDVGTDVSTTAEMKRENVYDVVTANARRVQEALRSLEEFGKTVSGSFAGTVKQLRYRSYTVEQMIAGPQATTSLSPLELRTRRLQRLQHARLYLLVTEKLCRLSWQDVVVAALEGGVDVIQLREKELEDDELIARGRWLAKACEKYDALFILNDRVDLAVAAGAHGVHLGQDDLAPTEARAKLPPQLLLGLSTHSPEQISNACQENVDYLGVGPVFPSQTKSFDVFPGLELVTAASSVADRPWFPIGGISSRNVSQVMDAGAVRIATCSAVIGHADPAAAAGQLQQQLSASELPETVTIKLSPS